MFVLFDLLYSSDMYITSRRYNTKINSWSWQPSHFCCYMYTRYV